MNLKYYALFTFVPLFLGCGSKLSEKEKWREMSCGLYMNSNSEIAFATQSLKINNDTTKIGGEKCSNVYITNINDTIPLKNIIDTLTFKHIGSTFFRDTNYVYNYYQICDGGCFNLKTNKKTQTMFKPKNELFFSDNDNYPSNSFKLPTKVSENNIYIEYSYYFDKLIDSVSYKVIKIKRPRK